MPQQACRHEVPAAGGRVAARAAHASGRASGVGDSGGQRRWGGCPYYAHTQAPNHAHTRVAGTHLSTSGRTTSISRSYCHFSMGQPSGCKWQSGYSNEIEGAAVEAGAADVETGALQPDALHMPPHSSQPGGWLKDLNLENEIDGQVCRQARRKVKQVPLQHSDQLKRKHTAHSQQPAMQAAAKWPQSMQAAPAGAALTAWPSRSARVLLWASWTAGSFGSTPKKLQGRGWGKAGHV